jgi:hypothetical protein
VALAHDPNQYFMKPNFTRFLFTCTISVLVLLYASVLSGCKDDPKPKQTEAQRATQILTSNGGTWSPAASNAITVGGIDVTQDLFAGFSITFSENTFTTTGTTPVWLREDTWHFKDATANVIIRGQDGKEITITEISDDLLKLSLTWDQTTYEGGRENSLAGTYEFVLHK